VSVKNRLDKTTYKEYAKKEREKEVSGTRGNGEKDEMERLL